MPFPLNQFAVINTSKTLSTVDLLFMVEACDKQVDEFSEAWGLDPVACVVLYGDVSKLPVDDVMIAWVCDSLDEPDALGYHSAIGDRPFIKVLAQGPQTSITLSHEFLETLGDPTCDRWARVGDGTEIAVEVADPVEGDSYPVLAVVMGEGRTVEVSNYVLPPYFDRSLTGPTNRMQLPLAPFGLRPGGYYVVLGRDGNESEVFAHVRARGAGIEAAAAKRRKADSRLARRLAAHP